MVSIVKFTKTIIKLGIFSIIAVVIAYLGVYIYAAISPKLNIESSGTYFIYDNKDNLVYQGSSSSEWVYLEDINDYAINAVLAIEDKNFYKHHGFDILRIGKAMLTNIQNRKIVQGASTVTQQLVKNLYLDFDKTWERKGKEAFLTIITEMQYEKDEILEAYLNTINYGQGNYGISNASQYYFSKKSSDLSLEEAIMLAGIPKSPNNYNPVSNKEKCIERAKIVAKLMLEEQYITNEEYNSFYSDKFFGTADAISFRDNMLRIHDLKTGKVGNPDSHIEQLEIYAALFCLEYRVKPHEIDMELRVYKNDEVVCHIPKPEDISDIMNKIVELNKLLEKVDYEEG